MPLEIRVYGKKAPLVVECLMHCPMTTMTGAYPWRGTSNGSWNTYRYLCAVLLKTCSVKPASEKRDSSIQKSDNDIPEKSQGDHEEKVDV